MDGNIFNSRGERVGTVLGLSIFDLRGQRIYDLRGSNIYKLSGELVGHIPSDVSSPKRRLDKSADKLFPGG
jgi:sporulation protein YlmC with PRC-barrel domain